MRQVARVFIIDDHLVVRVGLKELMKGSHDITIVGDAEDGEADALAAVESSKPDVILLDIKLKRRSGIDVCREIKLRRPAVRVILLSAFWDDDLVRLALDAGADGYLLKDAEHFELSRAVLAVASGDSFFDPAVAGVLVRQARGKPHGDVSALSDQDTLILRHVADGLTNKAIAASLYLSHHTVRDRVSVIMRSLGARNRTEAAQVASRRGLI